MTDIGILGLDTSHGEAFAEILERLELADGVPDPTITAVWDGGTVRSEEYVEEFCAEFDATRYEDPGEMVTAVDAAMVLTVDWDEHVELATPFLEADVPTFVDKPIAGTLSNLETLAAAAETAPLFGGSALPYHPSFATLQQMSPDRTLHLAGYNDFFYYRVHVIDAVRTLVAADWRTVSPVDQTETSSVDVTFADGTWATLRFDGSTDDAVFAALDVADSTRTAEVGSSEAALEEMYVPFLERFCQIVHGEAEAPTDAVIDTGRLLLAVEAALSNDRSVTHDDSVLETVDIASGSFVEDYEPYY